MIIILGDIHGNFKTLVHKIESMGISNCHIIQVGDFGIGYEFRQKDIENLKIINEFLSSKDITMYVIRGNHDDPSFFNGDWVMDNLKLLPDYTSMDIEGKKFIFIGGAISMDRKINKSNNLHYSIKGIDKKCYWEGETLVYNSEITKSIKDVDVVITHTAPEWCFPHGVDASIVNYYAQSDMSLKSDLLLERSLMSNIFLDLMGNNEIKNHFYGHFHMSKSEIINGINHHLIDQWEFYQIR